MASVDTYQKKRKERRRQIRRRRILISLIVLLILALITLVILCLTVFFPVTRVTVSGRSRYSEKQIVSASGLDAEDNLFTFSETDTVRRLQKKLPYVENVRIKRVLPGTVQLTVSDAVEAMCYPGDDGCYAISKKGIVLARYELPPEGLMQVLCNGDPICNIGSLVSFENSKTGEIQERMLSSLDAQKIKVNLIDLRDPINLKATVDGRFSVLFGGSTDLEKKIAHLAGMIRNIAPEKSGTINLSMWTSQKTEGTFIEQKNK